jgi:hypothetical protein
MPLGAFREFADNGTVLAIEGTEVCRAQLDKNKISPSRRVRTLGVVVSGMMRPMLLRKLQ